MTRIALTLLLLAGCSKVLEPIDRANCGLTWEVDSDADGTTDWTGEYQYDAEGRLVQADAEWPDLWTSTSTSSFDEVGCQTEFDSEYIHVNGDQNSSFQRRLCDVNGDELEFENVVNNVGTSPFDFDSVTTWEREYGTNGLTSEAVSTQTLRAFDIDFVDEHSYEYDTLDRLIRTVDSRDGEVSQITNQVWFDELGTEDLLASSETRDGLGLITSAFYRVFDDRGRQSSRREIDFQGVETTTELDWVEKRFALEATRGFDVDGTPTYVGTFVQDDVNPFMTQTVTFDNLPDGPDGEVDYRRIETWDCP